MRRYRYTRPCMHCGRTTWVRKERGRDSYICGPCDGAPIDRRARRGRDARRPIRVTDRGRSTPDRALARADMRRKRMQAPIESRADAQRAARDNDLWRGIARAAAYVDRWAA